MNLPESLHCGHVMALVDRYIDNELPAELVSLFEQHVTQCQKCLAHVNFENSLKESVQRSCNVEAAPDKLRQRVIQSISTQRVDWASGFIVSQTIRIEIRDDE
ncbi:MAG: hypothetical protein RIS43_682 [Actinomycetota bacterium]|jgi:mycothiol system anti-sigma-R factor